MLGIDSSELESDVAQQGTSNFLNGGVNVDQVDAKQGDQSSRRISMATTATRSPPRSPGKRRGKQ